jgi:glycosyltransferase involved in cell wall biosynthesis
MHLLFVHQNFPGQYRHLAAHFGRNREHSVAAIGDARGLTSKEDEDGAIRFLPYAMPKLPPAPVHRYLRGTEIAVRRAEQVRGVALTLKREGFVPDIICAHTGWGEALLLKDLFPDTPLLGFFEFYFRTDADIEFDPAFPAREIDAHRVRIKNSVILQSFDQCDWGITPTYWQFTQFPPRCRERISVIFDGIDTNMLTPNSQIRMRVNEAQLTRANEVITFVNRNLEPYRGFHIFMRCLPRLLRERPRAHVLIIGADGIGYGPPPPQAGKTWREVLLAEVGNALDHSRVHFIGRVRYAEFVALLQLSSVHVYLTYPFVLSWSMIEAMSCGCAVVGSATPPVLEVIKDGENGLLVDFFDSDGIVDAVNRVLDHPDRMQAMRAAARRTSLERYDLATICLPRHAELIHRIASREQPS